jgi:hypothetical protein
VVADCLSILQGDEPDPAFVIVLGGSPALRLLAGDSRADVDLWSRVWALRGLLWALDAETVDDAAPAIVTALHHPGWRVREKAAQVVARHLVDAAMSDVVSLRETDPVPRVRAAADRAVQRVAAAQDGLPRPQDGIS